MAAGTDDTLYAQLVLPLQEEAHEDYVDRARAVAEDLGRGGRLVTVNDIRARCPPPEDIDGRVMGALLRPPRWERVDYITTERRECHGRPIARFRLREDEARRPG